MNGDLSAASVDPGDDKGRDGAKHGGIAGKLVQAAADKIVKDGNRITATCSYAVQWFSKHPEYKVE